MAFSKHNQNYTSEITQFIDALKANNPAVEAGQMAGRALLWDKKPIDLDTQARTDASRVKQQAYVYQNKL